MPHRSKPRTVRTVLPGLTLGAVFAVGSIWSLMAASGYKFNAQSGSITQTAAIVLSGSEQNATVWLDGVSIGAKITTIRGLAAGRHDVKIVAPEHQDWYESFRLSPGLAAIAEHIELFLTNPIKIDEQPQSTLLDNKPLIDPTLRVLGTELYQVTKSGDALVTRFSKSPVSATWSNDQAHIFVQVDKTIYVTELQGENTAKLLELPESTPTPLLAKQNDSQLVLKANGVIQTWQIR